MDSRKDMDPALIEFNELTDRALQYAQHQDLCGMSACLAERRRLLERSRGFSLLLQTGGEGIRGAIQTILRKDLEIAVFLKAYRKTLEQEVARYKLLHAQHTQYAGVRAECAHFVDRKM